MNEQQSIDEEQQQQNESTFPTDENTEIQEPTKKKIRVDDSIQSSTDQTLQTTIANDENVNVTSDTVESPTSSPTIDIVDTAKPECNASPVVQHTTSINTEIPNAQVANSSAASIATPPAVIDSSSAIASLTPTGNVEQKETTVKSPVTDNEQEQQQSLDAISQLQQLSAAHTQLAQAAVAALTSGNNFPFLANFESSIAAIAAAATSSNDTNKNDAFQHLASASNQSSLQQISPQTSQATQPPPIQPQIQQQGQSHQQVADLTQLQQAEILKRELMNQKVRADNRERKKRWRQQNEERNKDNDLRCRVNKRAHKLFGKEDSEHKQKWIKEEFLKRQQKRKDKERRKGLVDDSLGGSHNNNGNHDGNCNPQAQAAAAAAAAAAVAAINNSNQGLLDLAALMQHLQPHVTIPNLADANYLSLLCNNLGIPAASRSLVGTASSATPSTSTTTDTVSSPSQQKIMNEEISTNTTAADTTPSNMEEDTREDESKDKGILHPFSFQLLEILQQLHQYQPQQVSSDATPQAETSNEFQLDEQRQQTFQGNLGLGDKPEEKLAALLATTLQAAAAAAANNSTEKEENTVLSEIKDETTENNTTIEHEVQQQTHEFLQQQQQQANNNNNTEFPMDAVLTLMQLNAGWRQ
ncbi:MAG: hypothetical protein EXX96DRAFT_553398 [Benjaminiella poitrasii]|nr:MAG: hypothetical protein EXX96DRAFT_553398 [Benjaminiella poitrasii]